MYVLQYIPLFVHNLFSIKFVFIRLKNFLVYP